MPTLTPITPRQAMASPRQELDKRLVAAVNQLIANNLIGSCASIGYSAIVEKSFDDPREAVFKFDSRKLKELADRYIDCGWDVQVSETQIYKCDSSYDAVLIFKAPANDTANLRYWLQSWWCRVRRCFGIT